MASARLVPLSFLLLLVGCASRPLYPLPGRRYDGSKKPLQTFRPYNLAHRGSNGEFPEETAAAYMRAIEEGADFIEGDVLASKDGVLIMQHDVTLDDTTDIAEHKEFANRKRTCNVQGINTTGFFHFDFTLEELKSLDVKQRYPFRDQQYNGKFPIITFEEFISIALDAPRVVGIYPEIKNPVMVNQYVKWPGGKKFEDKFVETLQKYGYRGEYMSKQWLKQPAFIQSFAPSSLIYISNLTDLPKVFLIDDITIPTQDTNQKYGYRGEYMSKQWLKQPAFIQSFAPSSLIYISNLTDLPKVFLIDDITIPTQDTNQSYWEITSDKYLNFIKNYVMGIGPWKDTIVYVSENYLQPPTDLVARAHALNLQVHPYTYRNENQFLHFNFSQDPYKEYDYWINTIGVDGLFTDFTGSLHQYQEWTTPSPSGEKSATKLLDKIGSMISKYRNPRT